jgi:hypothetical protein
MAEGATLEPTTTNSRPLPSFVTAGKDLMPTPNEMRALKAATGRPLSDLLGGDAEDLEQAPDRIQSLAWLALRRAGYDVSWEQAGDVALKLEDPTPDPTNPEPSNNS